MTGSSRRPGLAPGSPKPDAPEANCCLLQPFLLFSVTFSILRRVHSRSVSEREWNYYQWKLCCKEGAGAAAGKRADFPSSGSSRRTVTQALTSPLPRRGSHCPIRSACGWQPSLSPSPLSRGLGLGLYKRRQPLQGAWLALRATLRLLPFPWEEARCTSETLTTVLAP